MVKITAAQVKELRDRTGLAMMECKKALEESNGDIEQAIEDLRKNSGLKAAKKAGRIAAEGAIATRVAADGSYGVMVEVNSETDFVSRDDNFINFVSLVADKLLATRETDVAKLTAGEIEDARGALVQKVGENISVRRAAIIEGAVVGEYVHGGRIGVLSLLSAGDTDVAKDVAMHIAAVNPRVCKPSDMPEEELQKEKDIILAQPDMASKPAEIAEKMVGGRLKKFLAENSLTEQAFIKNPELTVGAYVKAAGGEVVSYQRFEVGEGIEKKEEDFAAEVAAQVAGR
ncbi:MAG TPA: translation elongation factor Ts [Marinospirillum sp.]|uniref:translation elongation factor Ts n=1 Tax=Marinospirillum sp. TaxID=2183934 RepID=UPI002B45F9F3|nr:translation elongation factor Ts [Marinospirillum sp.]HKM16544.1 translation elongation factor Ts [Marinospirillum sp.]